MIDLHIAKRLKALLPPLTDEERAQLKANIEADGGVLSPILWWNDGERRVIVDGMHRWVIAQETGLPVHTKEMHFDDYEAVEIWILDHQLGRRNLLEPHAVRTVRGELYNRLKTQRGGDHRSKGQNVPLIENAAIRVAEKAGVSPKTVKRDGARIDILKTLTPAAKQVAHAATDKQVRALAKLPPEAQDAAARAVRVGQATLDNAIKEHLPRPPRNGTEKPGKDLGKCPNCGGTKWDEDASGVACAKCCHPHGEPVGDVGDKELATARIKAVKTCEALQRCFDELNGMCRRKEHAAAIEDCKRLWALAKGWK